MVKTLVEEEITGLGAVPTLWSLMAQPSSGLHKTPVSAPALHHEHRRGDAAFGPRSAAQEPSHDEGLPDVRPHRGVSLDLSSAGRSWTGDRLPWARRFPTPRSSWSTKRESRSQPGEVGELVHRGPTVSMGYWGQPELTARVLRPHPYLPAELGQEEKVVYSGDLVKTDEDGFLYFVGAPRRHDQVLGVPHQPDRGGAGAVPERHACARRRSSGFRTRCSGSRSRHSWFRGTAMRSMAKRSSRSAPSECRATWCRKASRRSRAFRRPGAGRSIIPSSAAARDCRVEPRRVVSPRSISDPPRGELTVGGVPISRIAEEYGTPLFVYDQSVLKTKWSNLRARASGASRDLLLGQSEPDLRHREDVSRSRMRPRDRVWR